jgi:hypothetical protein
MGSYGDDTVCRQSRKYGPNIAKRGSPPMAEQLPVVLSEIVAALRVRFWFLNIHYEAAWTDSWSHRRCLHEHRTLIDAAKCAMPHGAGWYVFAVEYGIPRELDAAEEDAVNKFRFGPETVL